MEKKGVYQNWISENRRDIEKNDGKFKYFLKETIVHELGLSSIV